MTSLCATCSIFLFTCVFLSVKYFCQIPRECDSVSSPPLPLCSSRRGGGHGRGRRAAADRPPGGHRPDDGRHGSSRPAVAVRVQSPHVQCQPLLHGGDTQLLFLLLCHVEQVTSSNVSLSSLTFISPSAFKVTNRLVSPWLFQIFPLTST